MPASDRLVEVQAADKTESSGGNCGIKVNLEATPKPLGVVESPQLLAAGPPAALGLSTLGCETILKGGQWDALWRSFTALGEPAPRIKLAVSELIDPWANLGDCFRRLKYSENAYSMADATITRIRGIGCTIFTLTLF